MASAARHLDNRKAPPAAADQQSAIDELEKIWDAVIPFHPLLARDLADQTLIAQTIAPASTADAKSGSDEPSGEKDPHREKAEPPAKGPVVGSGPAALRTESEELAPLTEIQERTLRRTQLLKLKAEAELARPEPPPPSSAGPSGAGPATSQPIDPEQTKAGYQKAIELAPRAVESMEQAVKSLKQNDPPAAYTPADEARKILEEIQKAQPKKDQQDQDKKNEDQKKKDQKDQQKKQEPKKNDAEKKDQQKKDQEQKKQEEPKKSDEQKKDEKQRQPQVSNDRIEDALRKVRERQQEKHERDRVMKARVFGKVPVEKDW